MVSRGMRAFSERRIEGSKLLFGPWWTVEGVQFSSLGGFVSFKWAIFWIVIYRGRVLTERGGMGCERHTFGLSGGLPLVQR